MSLSSSLNAAVAGLDINSRLAGVVARNVANADTAGYARRSLNVGGAGLGSPGASSEIARNVDPRMAQIRREAQSRQAGDEVLASFFTKMDGAIGDPDRPGSLQDRLARLDAAFLSASSDPQSQVRLLEISEAAADLVSFVNGLDDTVTEARQSADSGIASSVMQLNSDLSDMARLNTDIRRLSLGKQETADLMDQRSVLLDRISKQVPVRQLAREDGTIALVSSGGVMMLDGKPAEFGFAATAPITPDMTLPTRLSGLTVNGRSIAVSGDGSGVPGGELAALFDLRDRVAPEATSRLDSLAADLIDRFESVAPPSIPPGSAPGLFTEAGSVLSTTPLPGLAGRLSVNTSVVPSTNSDPSLLLAYGSAIADPGRPVLPGLPDIASDLIGRAAGLKSLFASDRIRNEDRVAFSTTEASGLVDQRDGGGVDIDAEMRRLIEIEQAYAANARVIQAVGDMMNRLTEI